MASTTFDKGAKIARWERALENPIATLKAIGSLMTAESQRAFVDQRFGDEAWQPRRVPNVLGIIADFHAGKSEPPQRRFEDRPALANTGRLRSSIAFRVVGTDTVVVGSNLPYASVHQHGGRVESETMTESVRELLARWLRGKGARWRERLGWLLNRKLLGQRLESTVPARRFVGITDKTIEGVREAVAVTIFEVR
jgi:phage gpG-like protein